MKRILAFLLCFCLCVSLIPAVNAADEDEIIILDEDTIVDGDTEGLIDIVDPTVRPPRDETQSDLIATGACGRTENDDLVWKLYSDGELRIVGTGEMTDYHWFDDAPWKEYDGSSGGSRITALSIGEGVTRIGYSAFTDMDALLTAALSSTVAEIAPGSFSGCSSLSAFDVDEDSDSFCTVDGVLFSADEETLVVFPGGKLSTWSWTYEVPYGTVAIADSAFLNNQYLAYITLPSTLESIGASAFEGCSSLRDLDVPPSVTELPRYMCKNCSLIGDVSFYGVTRIAYAAFENCLGLHHVYIPNSVEIIEPCAFKGSGLDYIELPDSVQTLMTQTFMECPWLETVVVGSGVSAVQDWVFDQCPVLERVIFKGAAPTIREYKSGSPDVGSFLGASFTALYPAEKSGWSSAIGKDYGGNVSWEPYTDGLFIKRQTLTQMVYEGFSANFWVQIGCAAKTVYQWQYKPPEALSGAWKAVPASWEQVDSSLTIPCATVDLNGALVRCELSSGGTTIYTQPAELIVKSMGDSPTIYRQPQSVSDYVGRTAVFETEALGTELNYEWQYTPGTGSWKKCSSAGADTPTFEVPILAYRDGYWYRCRVYNASGFVYTQAVSLTALGKVEITSQPQSVSVKEDATAKFTVGASGIDLNYQWQYWTPSSGAWNDSALSGAKTATLSVKAQTSRNGYQYRCRVSNVGGTVYSAAAQLTVLVKPVISAQPKSVTVAVGDTAKFSVTVSGDGLSYQWQYRTSSTGSWNNCSGTDAKTKTLSVIGQTYRSGYQYRCKVTNAVGTSTSGTATLTVVNALTPKITTQPKSVTKTSGSSAIFSVTATGGGLSYQWQFLSPTGSGWTNCSDASAKSASLTVEAKSYRDGYQYRCVVTNSKGTVTSSAATLSVVSVGKPTISTQPTDITVSVGGTAKFKVVASSAVSYQWYFRAGEAYAWSKCTNGTSATLSVEGKSYRSGYQYRCGVTNKSGTTYSNIATLTVKTIAKPEITKQPSSLTYPVGGTAVFSVEATGQGTLSYQWYFRTSSSGEWTKCSNGTGNRLSVEAKSYRSGYQYRCGITNAGGTVYTVTVTLTVTGS